MLAAIGWSTAGGQRTTDARAAATQAEARPIRKASDAALASERADVPMSFEGRRALVRASGSAYAAALEISRLGASDRWRPGQPPTERPSAIPYVVTGAVVGAVAMAGGLWIYFEHSNSEYLAPVYALAPAVTAGGAVGAAAGWLVHRLRYR